MPSPSILDRFLVTGAQGMIGKQVPFGIRLGKNELDITSQTDVDRVLENIQPSGILHLASLDLRQCEKEPKRALETNVIGTHRLAIACEKRKMPMVYLSSGAIFFGPQGTVFREEDSPSPVNLYAHCKYLSERLIQETVSDYLIIRTGWVFGGNGAHQEKLVEKVIRLARNGETIQASIDQTGSPVYVKDLTEKIAFLIAQQEKGIIHVVNAGVTTSYEIALEISRNLKIATLIDKKLASEFTSSQIQRSPSEALVSKRITLRSWQEALKEYISGLQ